MEFLPTSIPGAFVIEPRVFDDDRGFFLETYHAGKFAQAGVDAAFVQDNHSHSRKGVLRGLHYQIEQPQGKLIRVVAGEIYDVAVDLRRSSDAFGRWTGVVLSAENRRMLYVPPGCAHGFYVTSDRADVNYKCTDLYAPQHERTLRWNDPDIGIEWPLDGEPVLSQNDREGVPFADAERYP
ncbi:MAG: dTDP-4-dehydrorhamnose 3,5-epimerase [Planctomycetota bacterium]|nr:MAG: dTDP-4-dehydrorhamnose 3,5-epimerase [Planctomycetota bacterium]REJ95275.1 MAG: dTDP-4-dehydrorhamnose 3,5-epimerase [Planctomycetota bacterium]REK21955.1 MAG: dTDP-4-dehydrorhamnose 3,5-epimerase [Planctomycetota bacterium]REK32133.1 MAG: dTDP-4-dehydrorhamnose 3,5-epimerase [Planctomycetota bacterium]